ncbi:FadR/GntR family transcriptional regulator [Falsiroseomonas sp. CW058]|uniref:FadR/GntR family transcriptional regulator n=1 Tax=Falsiroseomonas sp. CW058 TaxID=3388664 RepID=UPI003D320999
MQDAAADPFGEMRALAPVRLADGVLAELTAAILDGRLPEGGALPSEARIAARFGVSKQVVREAIRQLSALGVLEIGQGRATRVVAMGAEPLGRFWSFAVGATRQGLREAVELRRMLEPQVAALAAERATEAGIAALAAALARMEAALSDTSHWIVADLDFHETLARMTGNRLVELQMRGLRPVIERVMALLNHAGTRTEADWRITLERHARVLRAVAARDAVAAQAAMRDHFGAADTAIASIFPNEKQQEDTP